MRVEIDDRLVHARRPRAPSRRGWRPRDRRATSRRRCRPRAAACRPRRAGARSAAPSGSAPRARGSRGSGARRAPRRRARRRSRPRRTGRGVSPLAGTATNCGGAASRRARAPRRDSSESHGDSRRVALERAAHHRVASLAPARAGRHERHHARGVERVRERAVALLAAEQHAGEGLEAQVRRVGVRDREQVLGVEVAQAAQLRRDEAGQEAAARTRRCARRSRGLRAPPRSAWRVPRCPARPRRPRRRARSGAARRAAAAPRGRTSPSSVVSRGSPGSTSTAPNSRISASASCARPVVSRSTKASGPSAAAKPAERVGIDPDLARKRLLDREGRQNARRRSRPCTRGPGG